MSPVTPPSHRPELDDAPPVLGSWRNIYLFVLGTLAVLVALFWGAVSRWLNEYERYAHETCARANRLAAASAPPAAPHSSELALPPRKLFGLAFESRPPPLTA